MKRIIYHDEDSDGWMSAAVILKKYPDAQTYQVSKSEGPLEIKKGFDEVYVVDHSLWDENNFKELEKHNKKLIWIDHHKEAINKYSSSYPGSRDTNEAACILTWNFIFPQTQISKAVYHVGDRDIWRFADNKTVIFSNYLMTLPFGEEVKSYLTLIDKEDLSSEYKIGEEVENYKTNILEQIYTTGIKQEFLGYQVMVFDGDVLRSELMHLALERNKDLEFVVVKRTAYIKEGKKFFKYSMRSSKKSTVDVGLIATKEGGGGHKNAAGFITTKVL